MLNAARRPARWMAASLLIVLVAMLPTVVTQSSAQAATTDACGTLLAKPTGGTWKCTFVDNFTGSTLNTAKWNRQDTAVSGFFKGRTCFKAGQNLTIGGGAAYLKVTKSAAPFTCKTPYGSFQTQYLGADINTWGKVNQTYGRFEARLRYPAGTTSGYHGGFWMNPQDQAYGAWPRSGEIDVAEWWSDASKRVFPSLHYSGSDSDTDTGWSCWISRPDQFHTYRVEWYGSRMKFYYDNQLCFERAWKTGTSYSEGQPFDKRFFMSLTFGEGALTTPTSSSTRFPAAMVVDYVKSWS